jgi:hypothetical protein
MKGLGKIALAGLLANALVSPVFAASAIEEQAYEISRKTNLLDLIENAGKLSQFTAEEIQELQQIELIPVMGNSKLYGVPTPITAADNWIENRYSTNLAVTERLAKILLSLIDTKISYMGTLAEKLRSGTAGPLDELRQKASQDLNVEIKEEIVSSCKLAAALTPFDPRLITNFDEALQFIQDSMKILPSVNATVKLAPGYSVKRAAVYSKAKAMLPDLSLKRLIAESSTLIGSKDLPGKSFNNPPEAAGQQAVARQSGLAAMLSRLADDVTGTRVSSAGTSVAFDMYYQMALNWGISSDSPTLGAGSFRFPGVFEAKWPITANVEGNVRCTFDARIRDGYYFQVNTTNEGGIMDLTRKLPDSVERSEVTCEFFDVAGNKLSTDGLVQPGNLPANLPDRNAAANSINVTIQAKIDEFKARSGSRFAATKSMRTEFINAAIASKNGWKALPIPTTREWISQWENLPPSCSKVPRIVKPGSCKWVVSTKYPLGKNVCSEAVIEYDEVCKTVQKRVWEVIEKPVKVFYPNNGETVFDQILNDQAEFKVSSTTTQNAILNIDNDVCIRRVQIANATVNKKADFLTCDSASRLEFEKDATDDVGDGSVTTPGIVIPD